MAPLVINHEGVSKNEKTSGDDDEEDETDKVQTQSNSNGDVDEALLRQNMGRLSLAHTNRNNGGVTMETKGEDEKFIPSVPPVVAPSVRKYLVLLQDCLAIKFVSTSNNKRGKKCKDVSDWEMERQSLYGVQLYKSFCEANIKCYWNAFLCDAMRNLTYKGYVVPSTIFVFAPEPHMYVVRTAWARQMLRNPSGFRIEFVGEIEELIAEPVQQGQFSPLSDSLCWIILELTSAGQEAFVDNIMSSLSQSFTAMKLPSRELVYQTLEKLIQEQKIYQTSRGYFIVTPDTYRFMNAGTSNLYPLRCSSTLPTLDALINSSYDPDKISVSQHSFIGSDDDSLSNNEKRNSLYSLKRHHSLRAIRNRESEESRDYYLRTRSLSMKIPRSKSFCTTDEVKDIVRAETGKVIGCLSCQQNKEIEPKQIKGSCNCCCKHVPAPSIPTRKKKSLFRRWFSFRRSKKVKNPQLTKSSRYSSTSVSTQTLQKKLTPMDSTNPLGSEESDSSSKIAFPSSSESEHSRNENNSSKWNTLPGGFRDWRVHSRKSLLEDSPLYDIITLDDRPQQQTKQIIMNPHRPNKNNNNSSRFSTLSQDTYTSLGYGSGDSCKRNLDSPCPSVSPVYDSILGPTTNYYRRGSYYRDFRRRTKSVMSSNKNFNQKSNVQRPQSVYELRNEEFGSGSSCTNEAKVSYSRCVDGRSSPLQRSKSIPLSPSDNAGVKTFINEVGMIETHFNGNNVASECS